jgi:hypothetical protein
MVKTIIIGCYIIHKIYWSRKHKVVKVEWGDLK